MMMMMDDWIKKSRDTEKRSKVVSRNKKSYETVNSVLPGTMLPSASATGQ